MDLQHWQAQFENWLKNHHQHQDVAHDVCHFRRVWATAQKLAADDDVDMLVILTACYFHDIVSLAKNHPQRQRSSILAAEETRRLLRTEWGVVHQHPLDGLRRQVSAGGNIGERLMATGARHYGDIRATAQKWLEEVEIPANRIDDLPTTFSGGMQQRLQIARNLVTHPKLVFMDEPTGGLDVSVQARLLDLLRGLVVELNLAVVIVTHDLGVARLLADRLLVMKQGQVVESGLTDRVLDDPHHPYTQLLVSSVLQN